MKMKRYTAASMRAALALVRSEQGTDAVILSSRRIDEGIEVIAAVDYDETLLSDAHRLLLAPAPPVADPVVALGAASTVKTLTVATPAAAPRPARSPRSHAAARAASPFDSAPADRDDGYGAMQREMKEMRQLLENELAGLNWNDKRSREPLKARILEELTGLDIAPDVAMALAALAPPPAAAGDPANATLALLARQLPVVDDRLCIDGGVAAVVGPTGVGKTTTIAKLAARWSMRYGSDDLALVSTDGYRIGAREQLMTYARILGAPMHSANDAVELAQVLGRLKSKKLVLIDTAGIAPRDANLAEQFAILQNGAPQARILLALPAHGEGHALQRIAAAFAPLSPAACVLTKVDEAASLGAALSTALRHKLPIAYLCNGQRVPEDLHSAYKKSTWLVRSARELKEHSSPRRDEAYLARQFGRVQAHA